MLGWVIFVDLVVGLRMVVFVGEFGSGGSLDIRGVVNNEKFVYVGCSICLENSSMFNGSVVE